MNPFTNLLKPEAEAAIRRRIGEIPGLTIERLTAMPPSNINTMQQLNVELRMLGWSPSLNEIKMLWKATVLMDDTSEIQQDKLERSFKMRMVIQDGRFREGMQLGRASPFITDLDEGRFDVHQIDHLVIDRGLAELLGDADAVFSEVGDGMYSLHADNGGGTGEELSIEGEITPDHNQDSPGMQALTGRVYTRDVTIRDGVVYDGRLLRMETELPQTVMSAAAGRRLADVIDGIPQLADHVINHAEATDDGISVDLAPHHVVVGEYLYEKGRKRAA